MADSSLLKFSLKTNIVKSIFFEIVSKVSRYYYTFGHTSAWPTVTGIGADNIPYVISSEDDPPSVADTYAYELQTRRDMNYLKYIDANDAAIVVSRINWVSGRVYDQYDEYSDDYISYNGASSIDTAKFYVLTDEYNVYKCLYNNNNAVSSEKPTGNSTTPISLVDGYVWKFMYSIPLSLRTKFLTTTYMPVVTALSNQFYSNGGITSYAIENRGYGYIKNTWKVKKIVVIATGRDYVQGGVTITFPDSPLGAGSTTTVDSVTLNAEGGITSVILGNQGSGYTTQPIPTITTTSGIGFQYIVEYAIDANENTGAYTKLKLIGDGFNEYNPYSLKTVNIINRGVFASEPSGELFTFPTPQLAGGWMPIVNVTFREIGTSGTYEVNTITVTDAGYGYNAPLVFGENVFAGPLTADESGFDCDLNINSQKNPAELIPFINNNGEIEAIQVSSNAPPVGYTYASVQVIGKKMVDIGGGDLVQQDLSIDNTEGFIEAKISVGLSVGDIDSKQSNVELLAVDGAIPVVNIDFGGSGYSSTVTIDIVGDGSGCTVEPIVVAGKITKVLVTNPGSGYTYAEAVISQTLASDFAAKLRPIISPRGGHGKDAVAELYAKTIMLNTRLSLEHNLGINVTNDYRQICIVKNPKIYGGETYYKNATGSTCTLLECTVDTDNTAAYNQFAQDDELYYTTDKTFLLLEKVQISNKYYLLVQPRDNYIPIAGSNIYKQSGNNIYSMSISKVTAPEVNKYSGEMLYTDNRVKFTSSDQQTIVASTLITF